MFNLSSSFDGLGSELYGISGVRKKSIISGTVFVMDRKYVVDRVLLDTGALDQNYISPSLARFLESTGAVIDSINTHVRLGDSKTVVPIKQKLTLKLGFSSKSGLVTAISEFHVLENGYDMIVGLPTIVEHFIPILIEALMEGKSEDHKRVIQQFFLVDHPDLLEPFSTPREEAPEESEE